MKFSSVPCFLHQQHIFFLHRIAFFLRLYTRVSVCVARAYFCVCGCAAFAFLLCFPLVHCVPSNIFKLYDTQSALQCIKYGKIFIYIYIRWKKVLCAESYIFILLFSCPSMHTHAFIHTLYECRNYFSTFSCTKNRF